MKTTYFVPAFCRVLTLACLVAGMEAATCFRQETGARAAPFQTQDEAQRTDETSTEELELPMNWKKGDQRNYRITNHFAKPNRDGAVERASSLYSLVL